MSFKKALLSSSALRLKESSPSEAALERSIASLEQVAPLIRLDPEEILLHQGEEGDKLYVVDGGTLEAVDGNSGQFLHTFQSGDRFGERWLLFQHEPAGATVRAGKEGATLKAVSRAAFQAEFTSQFITWGSFRGRVVRSKTTKKTRHLERDIAEFRGIRYATRSSRFALPTLKEYSAAEVFDAFEDGPECLQIGGGMLEQIAPAAPKRSRPALLQFLHNKADPEPNEDCLCANIYAPFSRTEQGHASSTRYPVMVWIHGGAFITGAGALPMYNGRELAAKGVVVVCINYRLGALGFIQGVEGVPLNLGLHDQITALRWVQRHIHLFGGDPSNVTVFGESAGAMSLSCLLGMKVRRTEKLFVKAIAESGNANAVLSQRQALTIKGHFVSALLDHLRLPKDTVVDRAFLDSIPVNAIIQATETVARGMNRYDFLRGIVMPFQPAVWENGPLSQDILFECVHPLVQISRGVADDVTLLTGVNKNEYTLFMLDNAWRKSVARANGSKKAFKANLANRIVKWADAEDLRYRSPVNLEKRAQAILDYYLPSGSDDTLHEDDAYYAFERIHSVWIFDQGVEVMASLKAADGGNLPVYKYRLHLLAAMNQLKTPHALDLPLVFGTFKTDPIAGMLAGDGPETAKCSAEMMRAWVSFAKTGNPGWSPSKTHVFGAEPSEDLSGISSSVFLTPAEKAVWAGFFDRVEIDTDLCLARAKL